MKAIGKMSNWDARRWIAALAVIVLALVGLPLSAQGQGEGPGVEIATSRQYVRVTIQNSPEACLIIRSSTRSAAS